MIYLSATDSAEIAIAGKRRGDIDSGAPSVATEGHHDVPR